MTTTKYVLRNSKTGKYVQSIYASFTNEVENCNEKLIEFQDKETAQAVRKWLNSREVENYVVVKLEYIETEVLD